MAGKANPIDVEQFLQKTHFPAGKSEIVNFAKSEHAPEPILMALETLPDKNFSSPQEAARETFKTGGERKSKPMGLDSCDD